jgi:hypothetical protein
MLMQEAQRLHSEVAGVLVKSRALYQESRRLRGVDRQPTQDEIVERLIVVLSRAGYTAVRWKGGPAPIIAPEPELIQ